MRSTTIILIILIIVICIVARDSMHSREETFATLNDKANALSLWMRKHGGANATYANFIADNPDSNIVEYNKLRALYDSGRINSQSAIVESLKI